MAKASFARHGHDEIELEEFEQWATLGLMEAMERFDPALGSCFRTFATRRIHGSITDGIERTTETRQQVAACQRLEALRFEMRDQHQPSASTEAARFNRQVLHYVGESGLAVALAWLFEDSGMVDTGRRIEAIPFYRSLELKRFQHSIRQSVDALPVQERAVIRGHYLLDLPFEQVATQLNLTRGRISQIHRRALLHLRGSLRDLDVADGVI